MKQELNAIVRRQCERLDESGLVAISAGEVAEGVYAELDPERRAPLLVQASSKNDLRRRAEGVLRDMHRAEEERLANGQGDAFTVHLQTRYPCERESELVYVAPEHMSEDEGVRNVERLRKEGEAKLRHADALEAYFASRNSC